jgi:hypothetical protein
MDTVLLLGTTVNAGLLAPSQFDKLTNTSGINTGDNSVNTLYNNLISNVTTNLSEGTVTQTTVKVVSSDGTDATLLSASTTRAGLLTKVKFDEIVANTLKVSDINHNVTTNLGYIASNINGIVTSSDGTNATIPLASGTTAGLLSPAGFTAIGTITNYQLSSEKNQTNGYAGLDAAGKLNPAQLPALAITDTFVVANQVAMLALTAEVGDVAVRTDENKSYILRVTGSTVLANWQELLTPTDAVQSVFGRSGTVTAQPGDYTTDQVTETATKVFVTPALKTAITHTNRAALDLVAGTNTGDQTLASLGATGKYAVTVGDGILTTFTIAAATHLLGTDGDYSVTARLISTGEIVGVETIINSTTGLVTINTNVAVDSNELRIVLIG